MNVLTASFSRKSSSESSRPIKILQVCAIDVTAWLVLRAQLEAMKAEGWSVDLACSDGPNLARLAESGINVHPVNIARSTNILSHLRSVWDLFWLIRRNRYDVVNVHTPIASLVGRLAAKLSGCPLVIYTAHGFYFHDNMPSRLRRSHVLLERCFGLLTDHLFTVSGEDAVSAVKEGIMANNRVTVVGNGVQLKRFESVTPEDLAAWRAKLGLPEGAVVVGIVGRLVEEKGFLEFFEAARALVNRGLNVAFVVVGSAIQGDRDQFDTDIQRLLQDSALKSRVFFTGFTEEIPALMSLMDIFALPSHREGMPLSILEAMAAGRPVVATNIRGCREEVIDGVTGYLVPLKDVETLTDRIAHLIEQPELRTVMGRAGRSRVERLFNEHIVIDRIIRNIEMLVEDQKQPTLNLELTTEPGLPTEAVGVVPKASARGAISTSSETFNRA